MFEIENLFVTPHAIEQFRERIAPMDEEKALYFIHEGISSATNIKLLPDGNTLRIRTQRPFPFEFRAYCVFDHERGHFVVTTIVRGDNRAARDARRKAARAEPASSPPSGPAQSKDEAPPAPYICGEFE